MFLRPGKMILLALLLTGPAASVAGELPPRPQLEHYDNQETFVKDVLAWEKRKRDLEARSTPEAQVDASRKEAGPDDWHHITGPENLDEALRNAYGYVQPNYTEKYRFNRTTHLSFPLERLAPQQLSRSAIRGGLQDDSSEQRSLQPLPELRAILEETNELLELGELTPRQDLDPLPQVTHRDATGP